MVREEKGRREKTTRKRERKPGLTEKERGQGEGRRKEIYRERERGREKERSYLVLAVSSRFWLLILNFKDPELK